MAFGVVDRMVGHKSKELQFSVVVLRISKWAREYTG